MLSIREGKAAPLLSVILPAYNAEAFLEQAVQSVLQQSFNNFELIIIDDGSSDRTPGILGKIGDRRLRVIRHERNVGLISGLNEGLDASTGKYIARMDADDVCEPSRFLRQIECLEACPEVGVLGTAVRIIDEQGRPSATFVMPLSSTDVEWSMPMLCPIAHPSVMMRADLVKREGGYSAAAVHAEDYELWHRLSRQMRVANLREPLLRLRKHSASVTSTLRQKHLDAAAAVSKGVVDRLLDEDVPLPVVRCLRSWGQINSEYAPQTVQLLSRLLSHLRISQGGSSMGAARRDAAIRIAYLSKYFASGRQLAQILRIAHKAYPFVLPAIAQKAIRHFTPGATRYLVG